MSEFAATMTTSTPAVSGGRTVRRRDAAERVMRGMRRLVDRLTPEEVEALAGRIDEALTPPPAPGSDPFVDAVSGDHALGERERVALAVSSALKDFAYRRDLLAGSLTAPQVAALLGTSRQTPHDRVRVGALLAARDGGFLRFPAWQFDATAPAGVIPGLPDVVRALGDTPPLDKIAWFVTPKALLGHTPLQALQAGDLPEVLLGARTFVLS